MTLIQAHNNIWMWGALLCALLLSSCSKPSIEVLATEIICEKQAYFTDNGLKHWRPLSRVTRSTSNGVENPVIIIIGKPFKATIVNRCRECEINRPALADLVFYCTWIDN